MPHSMHNGVLFCVFQDTNVVCFALAPSLLFSNALEIVSVA